MPTVYKEVTQINRNLKGLSSFKPNPFQGRLRDRTMGTMFLVALRFWNKLFNSLSARFLFLVLFYDVLEPERWGANGAILLPYGTWELSYH